jgi:quercetin dioxygenase-like cupin family protein
MNSKLFTAQDIQFTSHPKFDGVQIGLLVSSKDSEAASVCILKIDKNTNIPVHTHDLQIDSIYVLSGAGKIYANGSWHPITSGDYIFVPAGDEHGITTKEEGLKIFVHHSPPLM